MASLLLGAGAVVAGQAGMPVTSWFSTSGRQSISIGAAQRSVQSFLDRSGNADLKIDELMEFQDNFYALIKERSSGIGAFELLVGKSNGHVAFEPGPDMMWNAKYGMMGRGSVMSGFRQSPSNGSMNVGGDQAAVIAQGWLDRNIGGDSTGAPDAFYGYYTFHFLRHGKVDGMLSVNGYTGQVWYHNWHGSFIQARDFGG